MMGRGTRLAGIVVAAALLLVACDAQTPAPMERPEAQGEKADPFGPGTFAEAARDEVVVVRAAGDDHRIQTLFTGEPVLVVGRELAADGSLWLRVEHFGRSGSSAFGHASFGWIEMTDDPPLTEVEPDCPAGPAGRPLEVVEVSQMTPAVRLHCFGTNEITIGPVIARFEPQDLPFGGEPDWLADESSLQLYGRNGWDSNDGSIPGHLEPGSDGSVPGEEWFMIRGRFDHPASAECRRRVTLDEQGVVDPNVEAEFAPVVAEDSVLWCRQQFVITDAEPTAAPPPVAEPQAPAAGGSWRRIPEAPIAGRGEHGAVWTGAEMIVWGGRATEDEVAGWPHFSAADGAAYDPATDTWRVLAEAPIAGRSLPAMAWTGDEVLVFGGYDEAFEPLTDGAAYDPVADTWRPILDMAPALGPVRSWALTDGALVAIALDGSAAAYDPGADLWTDLPPPPLPRKDVWATSAVWAEGLLIALAFPNSAPIAAAAYDPAEGRWRRLADAPASGLNSNPSVVWTGSQLIGFTSDPTGTGLPYALQYDPATDAWSGGEQQTAYLPIGQTVAIGDRLFSGDALYDPATDVWLALPARPEGAWESPVWTGEEVLLWGGGPGGDLLTRFNDGLAYRPAD